MKTTAYILTIIGLVIFGYSSTLDPYTDEKEFNSKYINISGEDRSEQFFELRNEYLTNGTNSCRTGEVDVRIETENRDNDYRHYNYDNNYYNTSDNDRLSVTYRHYIGTACTKEFRQVQQENMELKQQLELMKMCGRVNSNPSLAQNENFRLLVSKCTGVTPVKLDNRPADGKSKWERK